MRFSQLPFQDWAQLARAIGYAIPTTVMAVVGIILAWRWRRRMPVASRRVIIAFVLQLLSVVSSLAQRVYLSSSYFRIDAFGWRRRAILEGWNAVGLTLHTVMLGMLLWAVHGAYRARGDVERFI